MQEALGFYEKILQLKAESWPVVLEVAWILAVHQDEKYPDGPRAKDLARKLCKASQSGDPRALDVWAAAHAELGQFDRAVELAEQALKLASENGQSELAERIKEHLETYKTKKPVRQAECYYK